MIYWLIKVIGEVALRVFFRRVMVHRQRFVPRKTPLLIVSNHPQTFMDPTVIAYKLWRPIYFLTHAAIFKGHLVKWLFKQFHMIPIYRKEDVSGRLPDNRQVFAQCYQDLQKGKAILIFPEGTSQFGTTLLPFKSGAARIAIDAEREYDAKLGLRISVMGINYLDGPYFRGQVLINVAPPIELPPFLSDADDIINARQLTAKLQQTMEQLMVHTRDASESDALEALQGLYWSSVSRPKDLVSKRKKLYLRFASAKRLIERIRRLAAQEPDAHQSFMEAVSDYQQQIKALPLSPQAIHLLHQRPLTPVWVQKRYRVALGILIVGFPFFAIGYGLNAVIYHLARHLADVVVRLSKWEEYRLPVLLVGGLVLALICYPLECLAFYYWTYNGWLTLMFGLSLVPLGLLAWSYKEWAAYARALRQWRQAFRHHAAQVEALFAQRQRLLEWLRGL
jgi:glycerol-3-phosphate O-acyltransferase / dihydroxyacetone phosphate acyltransferase